MSSSVSVKSLSQISSNIVTWINAADINQSIGSEVTAFTGREGKDSANKTLGNYYLQIDSEGYKCVRSNTTGSIRALCTTPITANNNETFIGVLNIKGSNPYILSCDDTTSIGLGAGGFSYANYTGGSGRIISSTSINKKIIIVGIMTPALMLFYEGFKLISSLSNPAQLTTTRVGGIFGGLNASGLEIDYYSSIRIQEALSGERLRQAIRSVAFENGVKI